MIYDNEYDNDAMLTREYQRASRAIAQAEDNFNAPNRSIADWIAEGYTKPYAQALFAQANKRNAISQEAQEREYIRRDARTMVLATIDELNQYLLGNVTLEAATDAARELTHKLNESW